MKLSWQTETGDLACRWSEVGQRTQYEPAWMLDTSDIQCGYLEPIPDFPSHSPFGGPSWFELHFERRDSR